MKINDYILNISRTDVAAHYELKVKKEERDAFVTIMLIMFGIFIGAPYVIVTAVMEMIGYDTWMCGMLIIQALIIVIMGILLTGNTYRCGQLFKFLKKNQNVDTMVQYINSLGNASTQIQVTYILQNYQFLCAYIDDEKAELVIMYEENGIPGCYTTWDFHNLCDKNCENATLFVTMDGLLVLDKSKWKGE